MPDESVMPSDISGIMKACFHEDPTARPSLDDIYARLDALVPAVPATPPAPPPSHMAAAVPLQALLPPTAPAQRLRHWNKAGIIAAIGGMRLAVPVLHARASAAARQ